MKGVGTDTMKASAGGVCVWALSRSRATAPATTVSSPSSTNGTVPLLTAVTVDSCRSTPMTRLPAWASTAAVGRPMYPSPMTDTVCRGFFTVNGCSWDGGGDRGGEKGLDAVTSRPVAAHATMTGPCPDVPGTLEESWPRALP